MAKIFELLLFVSAFGIVAIASGQIANFFLRFKFPLITGFLLTGIICGPFGLNLITDDSLEKLGFINDLALAFIAFAAGNELYLKDLKGRFKSIGWNTFGQLVITFVLGSLAVFYLANHIPFMENMAASHRIAVAILAATIFVARSPASAIAVINELRAKGPFTQTAIGVTVVKDILVIILFTICFALADNLITGVDFNIAVIGVLVFELCLSFGLGYLLGKLIGLLFRIPVSTSVKTILIILTGFSVYLFADWVSHTSEAHLPFEIYLEPLLICILGSFVVTNYGKDRIEFHKILEETGIYIYIAFFHIDRRLIGARYPGQSLADCAGFILRSSYLNGHCWICGRWLGRRSQRI